MMAKQKPVVGTVDRITEEDVSAEKQGQGERDRGKVFGPSECWRVGSAIGATLFNHPLFRLRFELATHSEKC
jgi:hypothetical protein